MRGGSDGAGGSSGRACGRQHRAGLVWQREPSRVAEICRYLPVGSAAPNPEAGRVTAAENVVAEIAAAADVCAERARWYRTAGFAPGDDIRADEAQRCADAIRLWAGSLPR